MPEPIWKAEPEDHDYPAAVSYLSLVASTTTADAAVAALKSAPVLHVKAKDILRAAGLRLLPVDDPHVAVDLEKIEKGKRLSPVLLVRGSRGFLSDEVAAEFTERVRGARTVTIESGHNVQEDAPVELARVVSDFVAS